MPTFQSRLAVCSAHRELTGQSKQRQVYLHHLSYGEMENTLYIQYLSFLKLQLRINYSCRVSKLSKPFLISQHISLVKYF